MTERRDIGWRLENWSRVYRDTHPTGISPTAAFCDRLRREAQGEAGSPERRGPDEADAAAIEAGMQHLAARHRQLLWWCYIRQAHPGEICREMHIPQRPRTAFVEAFRAAQAAVQAIIEKQRFHDA